MADSFFYKSLSNVNFSNWASLDVRAALLMTNTTGDTDVDAEFIDDITTLDEFDGSGYSRQALDSEALNVDAANNRVELDAADEVFSTLGNGTRQIAGILLYIHVTNDTDSPVVAWIDSGGFPLHPDGGDLTITWNAEGILQGS
jgi:hypothetical protein